jgi:hypothetical protein
MFWEDKELDLQVFLQIDMCDVTSLHLLAIAPHPVALFT